ncbi:MAG: sulfite exporter TauE/SafE family protein [Patescibacteria group bacterium]|jgi:uncharacterized membrane protein YfcA|nr:sulfite exporter TauE/SafE family protein [Patescibacteria group bacterium]
MEILYIILIFILAGMTLELTGFGIATVSMSLLLLFLDPLIAIPLVAIIVLIATGYLAYRIKEKGTFKRVKPLFIGVIFGVPLGMLTLNYINKDLLSIGIGIFFILYSVYGLFFSHIKLNFLKKSKKTASVIGLIAGYFDATVNIDGPLIALYESKDIEKNKDGYKDAIATYMFFTGILTVTGHIISGRVNMDLIRILLYSIPAMLLGIVIGTKLFSKIKGKYLKKIIYLFVLSSGIILLIKF